jgi:Protein of unknown function (DUF3592)
LKALVKSIWIIAVLFFGIFIVSTGVGVSEVIKEHAFLAVAELDDGTITDYQVDSSGKSVVFCPIIDFTTKAGEPQQYEGADCKNHPQDVIIGQHVQVYFDSKQPDRFETYHGSAFAAYLNASGGFFFGFLFLGIALLMLVIGWASDRSQRQKAGANATYRAGSAGRSFSTPRVPAGAATPGASPSADSLQAEAERLKAETARLQAAEAELERKIEARRQQGQ